MLTDRRDIWATAPVMIKHPYISPGVMFQDWSLKGGGSISKLFPALVPSPERLELLLFNLKLNHLSELRIELSDALVQSLRGRRWLISNTRKLLRNQMIQFHSSSTALSSLFFSTAARGCATPLVVDIYGFAF